jgi:hypothetical protein
MSLQFIVLGSTLQLNVFYNSNCSLDKEYICHNSCHFPKYFVFITIKRLRSGTALLVKAQSYKPEGSGFDCRWGYRDF